MSQHYRPFMLLTAMVVLAACGSKASTNQEIAVNDSTANGAVAPTPAANESGTAPAPGGLAADFMVGKWSAVDEDCSATLEFRKDGTTTTPIGEAKWTVQGDKLSIDYHDGSEPTVSTIKVLGPSRIEITHASGTKETEKRC